MQVASEVDTKTVSLCVRVMNTGAVECVYWCDWMGHIA